MPAIQVARTDTFENQRQKINTISNQIFSIAQGGSDLSTGILKLGDGTKATPSLAFTNDVDTGLYRAGSKTIGIISNTKLLATFSNQSNEFFNDVNFIKNEISSAFINITDSGQNYDGGTFSDVPVIGGSGIGGSLNITVEAFTGTITNVGVDYIAGSFSSVNVSGGTGTGATITFQVLGIEGSTTNKGSSYSDGLYSDVPFTGGTGSGATFSCNVNGGEVEGVTISDEGSGYRNGDVLSASNADLGGSGGGFVYEISNSPGTIDTESFQFVDKGTGYAVGDVLGLPGGITGVSTTLDNTSQDITVTQAQADQIETGFVVTQTGGAGVLVGSGGPGGGTNPTVFNKSGTTITLSAQPDTSGSATLSFQPAYGTPTTPFSFTISKVGAVENVSVSAGGSGYAGGDVLTVSPFNLVQPITYTVDVTPVDKLSFTGTLATSFVSVGDSIYIPGGAIENTQITSQTTIAGESNNSYSNVTATGGTGSGAVFTVNRGISGDVSTVDISTAGAAYTAGDVLTIAGADVGGTTPTDNIVFEAQSVSADGASAEVYEVLSSGGNITLLVVASGGNFTENDSVAKVGVPATLAPIDSLDSGNKYFIDTGSGSVYHPSLTLFAGNTYRFNNASQSSHPFRFSQFPDGIHTPSKVVGLTATLNDASTTVTLTSTTGILQGMSVTSTGGGGSGGTVDSDTFVASVVDATTITLTKVPSTSGAATLDFTGFAYTEGVSYEGSYSSILVTETTPTLYYYCEVHPDMGGSENNEPSLTIDPNNPKTFGTGFSMTLTDVLSTSAAAIDISERKITTNEIAVDTGAIDTLTVATQLNADQIVGSVAALNTINSNAAFAVNSTGYDTTINSDNLKVGTLFNVEASSGDVQTSGNFKTLATLNVNDKITVTDNTITSTAGNNLVLQPASGKIAKVDALSALIIPVGDTAGRPGSGVVENGAIRFNTDNSQYEGYSAATGSWSSLGGVRDIDGNTYILAELTAGANDNTLWFYNDSQNTLKLTGNDLQFVTTKTISSPKLGLPTYSVFTQNTPVVIGNYVKYRNNLYEVTGAGTTGGQGTEPVHTSGAANSGTAQLTFSQVAVSELIFNEVDEVRIGPNKDCPLIIGQELKLHDNRISTTVQDLIIEPNAGKQVIVNSVTHFRIPAGNDNQKSVAPAGAGSIRFNTTIQQFEGYSGTNWSSLGGVRDVDGNTYIIPETAPAANENILYFYNNNVNTIQLTETVLDFTNIDTITTSGGTSLALDTSTLTLNSNATTIDNSAADRTFISTTKQYLDLGLSSGLNTDPVLRLDDQGDVYLNTTFGSGSFNGVKVLDGELKEFELADFKIATTTFALIKGGLESSNAILYNSGTSKGCKVSVVSQSSSGKRSFCEYSVIDNGTDIFHNEYGSLNTSGADGFTAAFDFTASTEARITLTLTNDHATSDVVNFTVLVQELK